MTLRRPDTGALTRHWPYPEYALVKLSETSFPAQLVSLAWIGGARVPLLPLADNVTQFQDGDEFLLAPHAFDFDFFVVQLGQHGVSGVDLVRLIRHRSSTGIVVIDSGSGDGFVAALNAGADMVLGQEAPADHLLAALAAVQRRADASALSGCGVWKLLEARAVLQTPSGVPIALSDSDLALMRCFAMAKGARVERRALIACLWGDTTEPMDNALHATLYRLRKRIERVGGQGLSPVHAVSRVGYEFRAPLIRA